MAWESSHTLNVIALMPATTASTSVVGLLSLLSDPEPSLQYHALRKLNASIPLFWTSIADQLPLIESLYENATFQHRALAASVASKVYFYLGEYKEALEYALASEGYLDVDASDEYVDTMVAAAMDSYAECMQHGKVVDKRLKALVEKVLEKCIQKREWKQALGVAVESQRLDIIRQVLTACGPRNAAGLCAYVLDIAIHVVTSRPFRQDILRMLVELYRASSEPDYVAMSQCFVHLGDVEACVDMLKGLIKTGEEGRVLMAYQIAFDLEESASQVFRSKVSSGLTNDDEETHEHLEKVKEILSGAITTRLNLEFLFRNNKTDLLLLKNTKNALDPRSSVYHNAVSFANSIMHAGTTSDQFLRENLDWLLKATNWSKFSAVAALGVIHRGHVSESMKILSPYLPQDGVNQSPYLEGGSLYALGLIHANHGLHSIEYLQTQLQKAQDDIVKHGACLGLGLAAMATQNADIFDELKNVLFTDSAVAGEAAGIAMGLVYLGSGNELAIEEMVQYAHETQHEKIIRGIALGLALIMYGREGGADDLIQRLKGDQDAILRYAAVYTIALAYCGTGNNAAIQHLLHFAVSDVSDDVRRASVIALGFLLFKTPKQVPRLVQLLSESYNPHVRYGAAMALGIACAGTGMKEAIELLEPMIKDSVDYVRQSAFIALGMVVIQHTSHTCPKASDIRDLLKKTVEEKHQFQLAKHGAALGQAISDAGGRNVTLSMQTRTGSLNMPGVVGLLLFTQFWYWFPLTHFLSLAMMPTTIICVDKSLKAPKMTYRSQTKPSMFAYPELTKPPKEEKVEKVATAVLSTTARAKQRAKRHGRKSSSAMDMDDGTTAPQTPAATAPQTPSAGSFPVDVIMELTEEPKQVDVEMTSVEEKKEEEVEAEFEDKENMSRVLPSQLVHIKFLPESRFVPIRKNVSLGVMIVQDTKSSEEAEYLDAKITIASAGAAETEPEAPAPEPFEYPFEA